MIEAGVWPRFARMFAWLAHRQLRGAFVSAHARGLERLFTPAPLDAEGVAVPTLVVANHSAWWDPMVAIWLHHHQAQQRRPASAESPPRGETFALMDAANLESHRFFQRCGAVGVDRSDPRDGARFMRWAANTLPGNDQTLWFFPQGREFPGNPRPLVFEDGAAALTRIVGRRHAIRVLPVGLDYLYVGDARPSLLISVGAPLKLSGDVRARSALMAGAVERELDRIASLVEGGRCDESRADAQGFERLFGAFKRTGEPELAPRLLSALVR